MLLAQNWSAVLSENDLALSEEVEALHAALQPPRSLSISFSGGLRLPSGEGWLEGQGPEVTIFGFPPEAYVHIFHLTSHEELEVLDATKPTNQPFSFDWRRTGNYRVEAYYAKEKTARLVKIVEWQQLSTTEVPERESLQLKGLHICGALVKRVKEVRGGWQYMLPI